MNNYITTFIAQAEVVLKAHRTLMETAGITRLPAGVSQFEITKRYVLLPASDLEGLISRSKVRDIVALSAKISARYFPAKSYSKITVEKLRDDLGYSKNTLNSTMKELDATGIWGRVKGDGGIGTRFYPLLTEDGYNAFLKVVDDAKKGIHPLYGSQKPSNETEEQEPQIEASEAPEPVSEPASSVPEAMEHSEHEGASEPEEYMAPDDAGDYTDRDPEVIEEGWGDSGMSFSGLPAGEPMRREYVESL